MSHKTNGRILKAAKKGGASTVLLVNWTIYENTKKIQYSEGLMGNNSE